MELGRARFDLTQATNEAPNEGCLSSLAAEAATEWDFITARLTPNVKPPGDVPSSVIRNMRLAR
jgi:hypothetical protein